MANKHTRLKEQVEKWRQDAEEVIRQPDTPSREDYQRSKDLRECADDVEKIIDDHTQD